MKYRNTKKTLKLNRSDFLYLASNDVLTSMGILVTIRFKDKHSSEKIKNAMRFMLSIYPRLRAVVQPTLFSHRIRVLSDDDRVDVLFSDSFKTIRNIVYDTEEFLKYRKDLLNEPFSIEQGLLIKIRYFPDTVYPVLLLSVHHIVCDGISWIHMTNSLLSYLNENIPSPIPLDCPSLIPVYTDKPFYKIFQQTYQSFKIFKDDIKKMKDDRVLYPSSKPVDFFGPVDMHHHELPYDLATIIKKSKEFECSLTVLFLAALSISLNRRSSPDSGNIMRIPLSVNLRPYFKKKQPIFGNYIVAFIIRIYRNKCDKPRDLIEDIKIQSKQITERLKNKKIIFPIILDRLSMMIGRKNYARALRYAKKHNHLQMTCALSNLGNMDQLNTYGKKAQVCETIATTPHHGLFMTISSLGGKVNTNLAYQTAEFSRTEIVDYILSFERTLGELLQSTI